MARFSAIINQFNGGMVTQRMSARNNLDMWPKSCREVVNFIPTVWGGNKFRGGTRYVDEFGPAHFIPFIFNNDIAYTVAFGNNVCRFYRNNKPVLTDEGEVLEVASPYSYADITGPNGECLIKYQQSADVLYLATGKHPMYKLVRNKENDFSFVDIEFNNGPFANKEFILQASSLFEKIDDNSGCLSVFSYNIDDDIVFTDYLEATYNASGTVTSGYSLYIKKTNPLGVETVLFDNVSVSIPGSVSITSFVVDYINNSSIGLIAEKSGVSKTFKLKSKANTSSDWAGCDIYVEVSWKSFDYSKYARYSGKFSEGEPVPYFDESFLNRGIRLFLDGRDIKPWKTNTQYEKGVVVNSDGKYYLSDNAGTSGSSTPVHSNGVANDGGINWIFISFGYIDGKILEIVNENKIKIYFADYEVYDWYEKYGFSAYQICLLGGGSKNFVAVPFFFNERLGIGINTDTLPKVCFSQSGDYENFDPYVDGEVVSESAVTVDLAVGETDTINWCTASSDVIVATDSNFTIISPATTSEPFGPDNIKIDYLSSDGANIVNPVQVGKKTMYIDEKGKSLFSNGYDWESNGFRNIKASWIAEDLFEEGIIELAYQRDPDFSVWALTAKGNLICFTYEPDQNVSAFSYHYTDGVIKSICAIPSYDGSTDELWLSVERATSDGGKKQFVEVMQPGLPLNIDKQELRKKFSAKATQEKEDKAAAGSWFVDCGIEKTSEEPFTEVDGLAHLEGKEVYGLADGNFVKARVVKDGKVTLDKEARRAIIGLPYEGYFIPNGIDTGAQNGTSQTKTQRISQMTLRVYRSCDFKCGDGYREQNIKLSDGPDGKISLFTGDYRFAFPGTYSDRYNKITSALVVIKQDKPFPLCVNGLVANMETIDG